MLWGDGVKTLFDPCPAGWRVPRSGDKESGLCPWRSFTFATATVNPPWDTPTAGDFWEAEQVTGGIAWYPAAGARYNTSNLYVVGHSGYAWSSTADKRYLAIDFGNVTADRSTGSGSYCFPVRCVRL